LKKTSSQIRVVTAALSLNDFIIRSVSGEIFGEYTVMTVPKNLQKYGCCLYAIHCLITLDNDCYCYFGYDFFKEIDVKRMFENVFDNMLTFENLEENL